MSAILESTISDVILTDEQKDEIRLELRKLEEIVSPLVRKIQDKYPSILIELSSQYRSKHTQYDFERGGSAQATFVDMGCMVSKDCVSWDKCL